MIIDVAGESCGELFTPRSLHRGLVVGLFGVRVNAARGPRVGRKITRAIIYCMQ
jgi:hypothetical protein